MQTMTTIATLHTFTERDSVYISARKIDENCIKIDVFIFYENCILKALRKYSREHTNKTSSSGMPS